MAEIQVAPPRRRGGLGWLWLIIALIVIALLVWYFVLGAPGLGRTAGPATTSLRDAAPAMLASWLG